MNTYMKVTMWYIVVVIIGMTLAVVTWPAKMKCATAPFVAPGNVEKACAQFKQEK